jgi:hypothetical protein
LDLFKSRIDQSLLKRTDELRRLTALLRSELPPECDGHYHVANIRDRALVIMTDSPVWTTRLRQLGPRIVTILQNNGRKNLLHIQVFSRPAQATITRTPDRAKTTPRQISPRSSKLLSQAASSIEDSKLRDALQKLARHTAVKNEPENDD